MFRGRRTLLFWFGLSVLTLASTGLFLMLGLIFIYYPTHYQQMHWDYPTHFPTYFWQYYIWQIIGAGALAAAGFFMMKSGTKKRGERETVPEPVTLSDCRDKTARANLRRRIEFLFKGLEGEFKL